MEALIGSLTSRTVQQRRPQVRLEQQAAPNSWVGKPGPARMRQESRQRSCRWLFSFSFSF